MRLHERLVALHRRHRSKSSAKSQDRKTTHKNVDQLLSPTSSAGSSLRIICALPKRRTDSECSTTITTPSMGSPTMFHSALNGIQFIDEETEEDMMVVGQKEVTRAPAYQRSASQTPGYTRVRQQNGVIPHGNGVHTMTVNGGSHSTNSPSPSSITSSGDHQVASTSAHHQQPQTQAQLPQAQQINGNGQTSTATSQRSSVTSQRSSGSSGNHQNGSAPTNGTVKSNGTHLQSNGFINNYATHDEGLVSIRMRADSDGRFGFNVKGGADQNHAIIVSRVAAGSVAEMCYPRLNEGDQVLVINGRDVTKHTHEQVVQLIRAARETHGGDLALTVRPNVYVGEDVAEPDANYHFAPEHVASSHPRKDMLYQSLLMLRDALSTGGCTEAFDQIYRRNPTMTMNICRLAENVNKNRYRDISPYDNTRVIIKSGATGDYINANFVNMEIAGAGIVNQYIAAQGPLPHTTGDFWHVVWEQSSTTIVMLTTTVERGRVKCHQYWPRKNESLQFDQLTVTCTKEKETPSTAFREMLIVNKMTNESRCVSQLQYMAWPDHGVPDNSDAFINFTEEVRRSRCGSMEPVIVHCSAGIGRTGVLILMETAMCLIEQNEPVYTLDITRTMRDQRAMLIQNSCQYEFVCEAILRAYNEQYVKPPGGSKKISII